MAEKQELARPLFVSASPHVRHPETVPDIMRDVLVALVPALLAATWVFGLRAPALVAVCAGAAVAAEAAVQRWRGVPVTVSDGSAAVTGVLLAYCCPVTAPYWMAALGSAFAVLLAKQAFGGLGNNPFNPAHIGRAFMLASWPVAMTTWAAVPLLAGSSSLWWSPAWNAASAAPEAARLGLDAVTAATPLAVLKGYAFRGDAAAALQYARDNLAPAFLGNVGGCVGETSALALLLGAAWLFLRGHLTWHIPLPMLATVFGLTFALTTSITLALFNLVAGGLILGAFFMATDMVTTPVTRLGRILFGVGCGFLVVLIRQFGAYPEGVCYSILIMNSVTPLLDTWTRPRIFGEAKAHA